MVENSKLFDVFLEELFPLKEKIMVPIPCKNNGKNYEFVYNLKKIVYIWTIILYQIQNALISDRVWQKMHAIFIKLVIKEDPFTCINGK